MDTKGDGEEESRTIVSRVLRSFSGTRLTPTDPKQPKTRPDDILTTIPSDAGTRPDGTFDSVRFHLETGVTPAEYVWHYLEANGPRIRQQSLAGSLEWSDSMVCRLVQSMEEDGAVETYLLGREKIICLPGTAPAVSETRSSP